MTSFKIAITSDTICPWCYIGLRRLQRGITLFQQQSSAAGGQQQPHTFTLNWAPFYLNPDAPSPSIPKVQSFLAKFGAERSKQIVSTLSAVGEQEGILFSFQGKTGRTRDSHRLIAWAAEQQEDPIATVANPPANEGEVATDSVQTRVVTELFRAFFEEDLDITDHGVLSAAAAKAGLSADAVTKFLASDEMGSMVDAEAREARHQGGISGVPNFIINDRFEVSGAQEPAAFAQLFARVQSQEQKASEGSRMA